MCRTPGEIFKVPLSSSLLSATLPQRSGVEVGRCLFTVLQCKADLNIRRVQGEESNCFPLEQGRWAWRGCILQDHLFQIL